MTRSEDRRVVAVVVTYNREALLRQCLDALAAQTTPLAAVVVIDNDSTDGSGVVAREHPLGADAWTLVRNVGGAGGFAAGMARALQHHDPDWVWLMDDDTIPRPRALENLLDVVARHPSRLSVLSSTAVWTDGRVHPMNVSRERLGTSRDQRERAQQLRSRPIRTASFVSILLAAQDCRRHGLPEADYFIWGDDTEYSGRLLRHGVGLQVRSSVVEHRTKEFGSWQHEPGDRFFYEVRNKIWAFGRSRSFTPVERILYGGSAVLGWFRTVLRSSESFALLRIGWRGMRAGVRGRPRPTQEVLHDLGEVSVDVQAVLGSHG